MKDMAKVGMTFHPTRKRGEVNEEKLISNEDLLNQLFEQKK